MPCTHISYSSFRGSFEGSQHHQSGSSHSPTLWHQCPTPRTIHQRWWFCESSFQCFKSHTLHICHIPIIPCFHPIAGLGSGLWWGGKTLCWWGWVCSGIQREQVWTRGNQECVRKHSHLRLCLWYVLSLRLHFVSIHIVNLSILCAQDLFGGSRRHRLDMCCAQMALCVSGSMASSQRDVLKNC